MPMLQELAAFHGVFVFSTVSSVRCLNPSCNHLGTGAEVSNCIMQVDIHWPWVKSLNAAILQAFSQTQLDGYICKDSDDCVQCKEGKNCSEHCGRSQAAKLPQLVDHGERMVFQLRRFLVKH